jgi:hypothetical protein
VKTGIGEIDFNNNKISGEDVENNSREAKKLFNRLIRALLAIPVSTTLAASLLGCESSNQTYINPLTHKIFQYKPQ